MTRGRFMNRPYNNFTNYAVSICKLTEIILTDLLLWYVVVQCFIEVIL